MDGKLTQKELKRLLKYNPLTGIFTWEVRVSNCINIGDVAGSKHKNGYIQIQINGKIYKAHRLAFLYMKGYFPEYDIDHRKGNKEDNRWKELRHVSRICNSQNCTLSKNNKSGFPGVYWAKREGKLTSSITINRKGLFIGYYDSILEAALARFTVEVQCKDWTCNYRSELTQSILSIWPEFKNNIDIND